MTLLLLIKIKQTLTEAAAHLSVHVEKGFEMRANERLITRSAMMIYLYFNE